jgi:hypothetical protein
MTHTIYDTLPQCGTRNKPQNKELFEVGGINQNFFAAWFSAIESG